MKVKIKYVIAIQVAVFFSMSHLMAQVEKFEKVILTRYFKPGVSYAWFHGEEFSQEDIKNIFFDKLQIVGTDTEQGLKKGDYRHFIDFKNVSSIKQLSNYQILEHPKPPFLPDDRSVKSLLNAYLGYFIYPIKEVKYRVRQKKFKKDVDEKLHTKIEELAKDHIRKMFNYNPRTGYDYTDILEQARRKSNDLDDKTAQLSADQEKVYTDIAEELLNRNYIFIYNFRKSISLDDYNRSRNIANLLNKEGYMYNVDLYVFKINWDKKLTDAFYRDCWYDKSTLSKRDACNANFEALDVPVKLIYTSNSDVYNYTFKKSDEEIKDNDVEYTASSLHQRVLNNTTDFSLRSILKIDNNNDLISKLGTREGLFRSSRFRVYDIYKNNEGEYKRKYRGVVVAKNIIDNSGNKSLSSTFSQERGIKLHDGMIMEQREMSHLNLSVDFSPGTNNPRYSLYSYNIGYRFNGKKSWALRGLTLEVGATYFTAQPFRQFPILSSSDDSIRYLPSIRLKATKEFYFKFFPYLNLNVGMLAQLGNSYRGFNSGYMPFAALNKPLGPNLSLSVGAGYMFRSIAQPPSGDVKIPSHLLRQDYNNLSGFQYLVTLNYNPNKLVSYKLKKAINRGNRFDTPSGFEPFDYPTSFKYQSVGRKILYSHAPMLLGILLGGALAESGVGGFILPVTIYAHNIYWLFDKKYRQNWYYSRAKRVENKILSRRYEKGTISYRYYVNKYNKLIIKGEETGNPNNLIQYFWSPFVLPYINL